MTHAARMRSPLAAAALALLALPARPRAPRSRRSWCASSRSARATRRSRRSPRWSPSGDARRARRCCRRSPTAKCRPPARRVLIVKGGAAIDLVDRRSVDAAARAARGRRRSTTACAASSRPALAALQARLARPRDAARRGKELQSGADEAMLPLIQHALAKETDAEIKALLELTAGDARSSRAATRRRGSRAIRALARVEQPEHQDAAAAARSRRRTASSPSPTSDVRAEARAVAARGREPPRDGRAGRPRVQRASASAASCCSPRSGLAITYGLMGVINMAHGELIMIGAYATYVVQNLFRSVRCPGAFDWYLLARAAGGVRRVGARRHGARAQRDPLPLRPAARDAARDLGHQPDPDPGRAHDLRRAERAGREPGVDVGRHRALRRTSCCRTAAS